MALLPPAPKPRALSPFTFSKNLSTLPALRSLSRSRLTRSPLPGLLIMSVGLMGFSISINELRRELRSVANGAEIPVETPVMLMASQNDGSGWAGGIMLSNALDRMLSRPRKV